MKELSIMIKPASSLCNLRCKYCFYTDIANLRNTPSFGIMTADTMEKMLNNIKAQLTPGDYITFAFQGGEPTLAGLSWFKAFLSIVDNWNPNIRVSYSLQTNGTMLDDEWCSLLKEYRFLVGLSLDLLPQCHNEVRVDVKGGGTYRRVLNAMHCMDQHQVDYNVLCTLTQQVARHPRQVWNTVKELDVRFVQFTPCLDALNQSGSNPFALKPQRFAQFYTQLFSLWYTDYKMGRYRSVKLFDDIVNLLAWGIPTACGMAGSCQPQMVVEADGSVYPCDFYCLDEYCLGNIMEDALEVLLQRAANSPVQKKQPLPSICGTCSYYVFCGGNCKRMRSAIACTAESATCGYQAFLDSSFPIFQNIARQQRNRRQ